MRFVVHVDVEHYRENSAPNTASNVDEDVDREVALDLKAEGLAGVVRTVKSLATNGPYMFVMLYGAFDAILINGTIAFGAKYFQQQFGLTAAMAGIVFGESHVSHSSSNYRLCSPLVKVRGNAGLGPPQIDCQLTWAPQSRWENRAFHRTVRRAGTIFQKKSSFIV